MEATPAGPLPPDFVKPPPTPDKDTTIRPPSSPEKGIIPLKPPLSPGKDDIVIKPPSSPGKDDTKPLEPVSLGDEPLDDATHFKKSLAVGLTPVNLYCALVFMKCQGQLESCHARACRSTMR